jgi:hypothetical protein
VRFEPCRDAEVRFAAVDPSVRFEACREAPRSASLPRRFLIPAPAATE